MFGAANIKTLVVPLTGDLAGGTYPLFTPVQGVTITSAKAIPSVTLAAGTVNHYNIALQNLGTAGAGTAAVAAGIGGTLGWAAHTPKPFAISASLAKIAAGEVLGAVYAETGTVNSAFVAIELNYVEGVG